jgi:hypothetical protein
MPHFTDDEKRLDFEEAMRRKTGLSDGVFSTTTIAYELGISRRTLQNKLSDGDPTLNFIKKFSIGYVVGSLGRYSLHGVNVTCPGSAQTARQMHEEDDGRHRNHTGSQKRDPLGRFTAVSGVSVVRKVG